MLHRRAFFGLVTAIVLTACAPPDFVEVPEGTKLIIVRHADRTGEDLNELGIARAEALVSALEDTEIDAIYTLDLARNRDTAAPISAARGLVPIIIPDKLHAWQLMTKGKGQTILWVGNKGNLSSI